MLIVLIGPYENTRPAERLAATRESRPICCVCASTFQLMAAERLASSFHKRVYHLISSTPTCFSIVFLYYFGMLNLCLLLIYMAVKIYKRNKNLWYCFSNMKLRIYDAGTECAGSEYLCNDVLVHMASLKWKSLAQSNEEATISVQDTHDVQSDWQQLQTVALTILAALLEFHGELSQQIER